MEKSDLLLHLGPDRFRTVSSEIILGKIKVPGTQEPISALWRTHQDYSYLDPGDIETSSREIFDVARPARSLETRVSSWLRRNLASSQDVLPALAVSRCRAAPFHHDIRLFAANVFFVVWLEDYCGLDLVFPLLEKRVRLEKGKVVLFDPAQVHGVVYAGRDRFFPSQYEALPPQLFLSIDLDVRLPDVARPMGIELRETAAGWDGPVIPFKGAGPTIDPETGNSTSHYQK